MREGGRDREAIVFSWVFPTHAATRLTNTLLLLLLLLLLLQCVDQWLEISDKLRKMHNWHMLFALQNAFQRHQLDRLNELWASLSRKQLKRKKYLEDTFSAADKMAGLLAEQRQCLGRVPMIPCIFWLVQKATLLGETPLYADDGTINVQHFVAANNVFEDM